MERCTDGRQTVTHILTTRRAQCKKRKWFTIQPGSFAYPTVVAPIAIFEAIHVVKTATSIYEVWAKFPPKGLKTALAGAKVGFKSFW